MARLKVMVVDDSAFMRKIVGDMVSRQGDLELIATARDGIDALKKLEKLQPDVITLDVEMPKMDGLTTIEEIQKKYQIPIIMLSSLTAKNSKITMEALDKGAYDFIQKPSGSISLDIEKVEEELIEKIRSVTHSRSFTRIRNKNKKIDETNKISNDHFSELPISSGGKWSAIVIGASTGGPRTLSQIINNLPKCTDSIPIFIVQHMPKGFTASFAERLDNQCSLKVKEAQDGELIRRGHIYIAPGDYHMNLDGQHIRLDQRDKTLGVRPAVDYLFQSAAPLYKDKLLAVILTGMGRDGTKGMKDIKKWGGTNIAQDKESSVIFGMPGSAIASGVVDQILSLDNISKQLNDIVRR